MSTDIDGVLAYHRATKHGYDGFAPGPRGLDWANQPDPFRRYAGAPVLPLEQVPVPAAPPPAGDEAQGPAADIPYDRIYTGPPLPPAPLNRHSLSRLLYDSLALSAWKQAGGSTWALRVNPSSGNLHPTEGYVVCGPVEGLCEAPMVAHYAPREHALERRADLPADLWAALSAGLPEGGLLLGLSSIHWREAWKYGERAYRYCQLDVGHALGAVAVACAALGWRATLLEDFGDRQIGALLGLGDPRGEQEPGRAEVEHPDCLLAIAPADSEPKLEPFGADLAARLGALEWRGRPNHLSAERVHWPQLEAVAEVAAKPPGAPVTARRGGAAVACPGRVGGQVGLRGVMHRRRSAVDMDPAVVLDKADFYRMLCRTLGPPGVPFEALGWPPQIHLALFVHRVSGLAPGLYLLLRDPGREPSLRAALRREFEWQRLDDTPDGMGLYRLVAGDATGLARQLSCQQDIAGNSCFSLGMIARLRPALAEYGPWFYRRLYWEAGMIGQVLYLEACANGIAATGIGCFFDDPVHELLGLAGEDYQSLYHFTVGAPVDDPRLSTLPPYPAG